VVRNLFQTVRQALVAAGGRQIVPELAPQTNKVACTEPCLPVPKPEGKGLGTVVALIGCELTSVSQQRLVISVAATYPTGAPLRNIRTPSLSFSRKSCHNVMPVANTAC